MAEITRTKYPNIGLDQLLRMSKMPDLECVYYDKDDTFCIYSGSPRPAVSFDINGEVWLRIDPDSGDIIGLEIEDFESIFLKRHPELSPAWQQAKPYCRSKKPSKHVESTWESFLRIIMGLLSSILKNNPPQATLMAY
ncbi:MAG: DUF2283 domain-containing protein [Chloroflexi bacterium]|nr:DUF2283 domain-containing protein [Chloroflexota bacterium]